VSAQLTGSVGTSRVPTRCRISPSPRIRRRTRGASFDGKRLSESRRHGHIDIDGSVATPSTGPVFPPEFSADQAHLRAVIVRDNGNIRRLDPLIARRRHLERARKDSPQLESVHAPRLIAPRHLLVDDPAAAVDHGDSMAIAAHRFGDVQ